MGKLSSSQRHIHIFQNSNFCWIARFLLWATNTVSCFPWSDKLTLFISDKVSAKYPSLNSHGLSVILSSKSAILQGKKQFSSQLKYLHRCTCTSVYRRKSCICAYHLVTLKRSIFKDGDLIKWFLLPCQRYS